VACKAPSPSYKGLRPCGRHKHGISERLRYQEPVPSKRGIGCKHFRPLPPETAQSPRRLHQEAQDRRRTVVDDFRVPRVSLAAGNPDETSQPDQRPSDRVTTMALALRITGVRALSS